MFQAADGLLLWEKVTSALDFGEEVTLETHDLDESGRTLADVFLQSTQTLFEK